MASLVKNGKHWGLIWSDSSRNPRQVRESLKTDSHHRAKTKKKELEWKYHNNEHDPWKRKWYERKVEKRLTLPKAVEEFIIFKSRAKGQQGWSDLIAKNETWFMRMFAEFIGSIPIEDLTEKHLEDFYYRKGVNSDHTRNSNYISVNTFLNWCIEKGYIKEKPVYKPKKPQTKIPKFIYPKELSELIKYRLQIIEGDWKSGRLVDLDKGAYWQVLGWMILAGTGMRPDELSKIKLQDIEKDSILIGGSFTTKVRSERRVPLLFESKQAVDLLTSNFRQREPYLKGSQYLLGRKPSHAKTKLSREFSKAWERRFPNKAKRSLYNLKDMFAVRFLTDDSVPSRSGIKINDLKEILGHASLGTTQKYLKAIPFGTSVEGTIWDY